MLALLAILTEATVLTVHFLDIQPLVVVVVVETKTPGAVVLDHMHDQVVLVEVVDATLYPHMLVLLAYPAKETLAHQHSVARLVAAVVVKVLLAVLAVQVLVVLVELAFKAA